MGQLTESQYKIIADRMIEEHRKYGDRLRPGHWADVAARKVVSHMDDFREEERTYTASEVRAAAMAEPVLPDEMPDEMWEACRSDRAVMQEALRVVVRLTRDGILNRLIGPA